MCRELSAQPVLAHDVRTQLCVENHECHALKNDGQSRTNQSGTSRQAYTKDDKRDAHHRVADIKPDIESEKAIECDGSNEVASNKAGPRGAHNQ